MKLRHERLSTNEAACVLAFIVGSLVLGAFAPRRTSGFAAPGARLLVESIMGPLQDPLQTRDDV